MQRRHFFYQALAAGALTATGVAVGRHALAALPEPVQASSAATAAPWTPPGVTAAGRPYRPVVTLNGWTLPFRLRDGVKEFHLVAEPVVREIAPGFEANLWGYNGQSPGPTIEVVEDDRVRIYVTNRLPEPTSIHWHGQRLPAGMDGVSGINQPSIPPGQTWIYEFQARRPGTFMYHPHADEMVQLAMGMMGMWVTHPRLDARGHHPQIDTVQRDYAFLINAFDIKPGARTPTVATMLDFNTWAWNSRVFPGIDTLVARLGERVRIRIGNLTMVNHPIHVHGVEFEVTGTDGGPVPPSARWPEVTVDIAVGQMRQIEFIADEPGDWAVHCHKSHHTMGPMGHDVPTMIGVDHRGLVGRIQRVAPDYMVMGERGMYDMKEMPMELPPNTLPMMTGRGPFGPIGMGGMLTQLKVRADLAPDDYRDPGPYAHPRGTVAFQHSGAVPELVRAPAQAAGRGAAAAPASAPPAVPAPAQGPATPGQHRH